MTEDTTVSVAENATRFELDDRQRAMLAEMGVRVWMQQAERAAPALASVAAQTAAPPTSQQGAASTSVHPVSNAPQMVSVPIVDISNLPDGIASMDWAQLQSAVMACTGCGLCQSRQQAILGEGLASADWMIVGDAPGEEEDQAARSFAGPAGQLLDNMLKALSLTREQVYLTHALKCRTPLAATRAKWRCRIAPLIWRGKLSWSSPKSFWPWVERLLWLCCKVQSHWASYAHKCKASRVCQWW